MSRKRRTALAAAHSLSLQPALTFNLSLFFIIAQRDTHVDQSSLSVVTLPLCVCISLLCLWICRVCLFCVTRRKDMTKPLVCSELRACTADAVDPTYFSDTSDNVSSVNHRQIIYIAPEALMVHLYTFVG